MRNVFTARRRLAAAALLSMALLVTGCTANTPTGATADVIRVGVVGMDFSNIDPALGFTKQINSFTLETLMKLSPTGEVEPNLAESVEQRDETTYVYHLREDVTFSNGKDLTADDVVASIERAMDPEAGESFRYSDIQSIEAEDEDTVVVTIASANASFQYVLAIYGNIFDAEHAEEAGDDFGKPSSGVIGTGPYVIDELDPNGTVTYSANESYWGGAPAIAQVVLQGFADETSEAIAFRTGDIDLAFPADVRSFEATADTTALSVPGTRQGLFIMNVGVAPWDDVNVRRAVAYAINKEEIIGVIGGNAEVDSTIIPPTQLLAIASQDEVDALVESLPTYDFDLDAARAELSKSAYPDGFSAVLETPTYGGYVETAQAIAGQLQQIGITLEVRTLSEGEYTDKFFSRPHSEVPVQYTYFNNRTPDPGNMPKIALLSSATAIGQNNFADYVNPRVDELIALGDSTLDPAERFGYYSELLEIVAEDVPYIPLYVGNINVALSDKFEWPTFNAFSNGQAPFILEIVPKG